MAQFHDLKRILNSPTRPNARNSVISESESMVCQDALAVERGMP